MSKLLWQLKRTEMMAAATAAANGRRPTLPFHFKMCLTRKDYFPYGGGQSKKKKKIFPLTGRQMSN
jgi:hypothetical protein